MDPETAQIQNPEKKIPFIGAYLLPIGNSRQRAQEEFLLTDSHSGSEYVSFEQLRHELIKKNDPNNQIS